MHLRYPRNYTQLQRMRNHRQHLPNRPRQPRLRRRRHRQPSQLLRQRQRTRTSKANHPSTDLSGHLFSEQAEPQLRVSVDQKHQRISEQTQWKNSQNIPHQSELFHRSAQARVLLPQKRHRRHHGEHLQIGPIGRGKLITLQIVQRKIHHHPPPTHLRQKLLLPHPRPRHPRTTHHRKNSRQKISHPLPESRHRQSQRPVHQRPKKSTTTDKRHHRWTVHRINQQPHRHRTLNRTSRTGAENPERRRIKTQRLHRPGGGRRNTGTTSQRRETHKKTNKSNRGERNEHVRNERTQQPHQ